MDLITDWLSFSLERRGEETFSMETRVFLMSNVHCQAVLPTWESVRSSRSCMRAAWLTFHSSFPTTLAVKMFGWTGLSVLRRELLCATALRILNYLKRRVTGGSNLFLCFTRKFEKIIFLYLKLFVSANVKNKF